MILALLLVIQQPNGHVIPDPPGCSGGQPTGLGPAFACVCSQPGICNIGVPCTSQSSCDNGQHGTCETTMWHSFNDNTCIPSNLSGLDPRNNASITPQTFRPTCPLTFTVITRGSARFRNAFGWYNVTGQRPDPSDLHVMLDCNAQTGAQAVLDIRNEPDYRGGDVAFFLLTPEQHGTTGQCAGGDCCARLDRLPGAGYVYYSESQWNPDQSGTSSFIHLLIYDSRITQRKFYFAWEDIYGGSDDEFTDLVTSVEGVQCSGAGMACSTGMPGACAEGVTNCAGGQIACQGVSGPMSEICDGLDNDCNGLIDDGATCSGDGEICHNGRCVHRCTVGQEFACPSGYTCEESTGFCVESGCVNVTCPADKVCRAGQCVGGCDNVVCPHGQLCRLGSCIDPCSHRDCPQGQVCARGLCVPGCSDCGGLVCGAALQCTMDGRCIDPSCPAGCPPGTFCEAGSCHDACEGAQCPSGQTCQNGECQGAAPPGSGGTGGTGGSGGSAGNSATGAADAGCACGPTRRAANNASLGLLALALLGRRRRGPPRA